MHRQPALFDVTLFILCHVILDADVGERAAHHHLVIAAPGSVLIEVGRRDVVGEEIFSGRRSRLDRPRR